MKRLVWLCGLVVLSCPLSWARDYYVATDGNDTNAGTFEKPFATLEKAKDAVRQERSRGLPGGGVTVWLRDGRYFRTQSFALTSADGGEPNKPIVYRAYPGEEVRLIGGRELRQGWFSPVVQADPAWSRLDTAARGQCLKVDLASHAVAEYGEPLRTEISFNGELMPLARWPNEGFVSTTSAENNITFGYDDPRPQRWLQAPDLYAAGYWRYGWANRIEKVASIDTAAKKITLAKAPSYGIQTNKPYFVLNLLEEIDRPGEWYLDRQAHVLYFWPPSDMQAAEILISTLAQPIITMKDASYVRLEALTLEMGADDAVEITGGRETLVANCTIRNMRKDGITLSGQNNGVSQCEIHAIGETGVSLSGGDRAQLISCGNFARDCRIHDFGRWERTYAPAIQINGVGCIATGNLLYNGPHSAVLFGGNEHLIELNEIHSVCYEVDDAGSIYCGRDWGLQGNVIRHNFFHDIKSNLPGSNGVHAVYLDDCASGITVFGNTFYQVSGRAIMCGGGRDNTIENNIIAKCGSAHFTDRRGKVWIDKDESWRLLDKIKRYNYTEPPWSTRYPRLAHILDNGYEQAKEPEGCVIRTNIGWQNKRWLEKNCLGACGGFDFYTIENNIEDQDPQFVNEQNLNLALRDDSPAYSLPGFQRILFEQIGPQDGDEQPAWPLVKRAGFVSDPNVLLQGTSLRETSSSKLHRIPVKIADSQTYSLGSDSVMTFLISGDHVLQPVNGGRWRLGGTLEIRFAGRYEPHEASVFVLFDGAESLEGRFDRVVLPAGWRHRIEYGQAGGKVTLSGMHPDRAPAFPGAEGFGKYTLGGRGGRVCEVTNLNDGGPGSLRAACEAKEPRTVVFRVSGTIPLQSRLRIRNPYITIAGQTAPGDGVCIRNYQVEFETDQVILRYLRFRLGDESRQEADSFGGQGSYAIIDHCSASWSVDETFSVNKASNLTVQWCMVTESLHDSIHKKGKHGYGGLWGGPGGSWHHNILAHHASRNPRASGNRESGLMDFRNNVIYNWGFNSSYGGEGWPRNWINNYYKYGPATDTDVRHRIFIQSDPRSKAFTQGNYVWGFPEISRDNWNGGIDFQQDGGASQATLRVNEPFVVAPVRTQTAEEAYELVLRHAGASLVRDAVDARIIEEIRTGTAHYGRSWAGGGKGIIDSQRDVGGWPVLRSTTPPADSDRDGMPDEWERAHNLNPDNAADGPADSNGDGYTNLEDYLNSLVPSPYAQTAACS